MAEQRLKQGRATGLGNSLITCMGFGNIMAACFPAQACASITNAPDYRQFSGRAPE